MIEFKSLTLVKKLRYVLGVIIFGVFWLSIVPALCGLFNIGRDGGFLGEYLKDMQIYLLLIIIIAFLFAVVCIIMGVVWLISLLIGDK